MNIPFNDMKSVHHLLAGEIQQAVNRVIDSGWYILGPEVEAFEAEFAAFHGVQYAISVANGTDAIELALRAGGVGRGDEVITVSHTAVPTVCAIERTGAQPVLVDIDPDRYTINPAAVEAAITPRTRAIVPVHLYGHPADMTELSRIAGRHGLLLVEDCAQAHGARLHDRWVGMWGHLAAFSFYPTKNLGTYGDGGAIITNDSALAEKLRRLRNYGQVQRYINVERGINSRLDEIQAAILRVKLNHLAAHNQKRRQLAQHYHAGLASVKKPVQADGYEHVYHLYVIRHAQRDRLMKLLNDRGVGTLIHYPIAVHQQEAYADLGYASGSLPITEAITGEILSLPMYVSLEPEQIKQVSQIVNECVELLGNG